MEVKDFITNKVWNELERVQQIAETANNFELNSMITPMHNKSFDFMAGFEIETLTDESGTWLKTKLLTTADFSDKVTIQKHRIGRIYRYQNESKPQYKYWIRFLGSEHGFSVTNSEMAYLNRHAIMQFNALKSKTATKSKRMINPHRVYA